MDPNTFYLNITLLTHVILGLKKYTTILHRYRLPSVVMDDGGPEKEIPMISGKKITQSFSLSIVVFFFFANVFRVEF